MSDSDGIGSPGRQRRSTERSRENIREYVKLLGKKVCDPPTEQKSPKSSQDDNKSSVGGFLSKSQTESEGTSVPSLRAKTEKQLTNETSESASPSPKTSQKDKRISLTHTTRSPKKNSDACPHDSTKLSMVPLLEKDKNIVQEKGGSPDNKNSGEVQEGCQLTKIDKLHNENTDGFHDYAVQTPKSVGGVRRSSSDSKRSLPKTEKKGECGSDSPPDLTIFLKEGCGRTQTWSEPPVLDPESIATRSRTRVPTDAKLQSLIKSSDSSKSKGSEGAKKEIKKEKKSAIIETPESLKRLAQSISKKTDDITKSLSTGKGKTKVASANDARDDKNKLGDSDDEKSRGSTVFKAIVDNMESTSHSSTPEMESTSKQACKGLKRAEETEESTKTFSVRKQSSAGGKTSQNDDDRGSESKVASVVENEGSKKDAATKENNVKRLPEGKSNACAGCESSKDKVASDTGIEVKPYLSTEKVSTIEMVGNTTTASSVSVPQCDAANSKRSQSPLKDSESKNNEIRITRSIVSPEWRKTPSTLPEDFHKDPAGVSGKRTSAVLPSSSMDVRSGSPNPSVLRTEDKCMSLNSSDLVTIAAANPGNGSPIRYRKIHIKIPNVQRTQTGLESSVLFGSNEALSLRSENTNSSPKGTSTPEKRSREISDSPNSLNLRLSPIQQAVELFDFCDIEAEEVIVGDTDDFTTISAPESDAVKLMEEMSRKRSSETNQLANEPSDSSSEEDNSKLLDRQNSIRKKLLRSPEGRVALDHSYSSGSSEGCKGSNTYKKKACASQDKKLSPRPVYSTVNSAKRSLDIMMHNDKINILRQMSQIFNNEKPSEEEKEESLLGTNTEDSVKMKCKMNVKADSTKNRVVRPIDMDFAGKSTASYVLTPEKTFSKSPSKLLLVEALPAISKPDAIDIRHLPASKTNDSEVADDNTQSRGESSKVVAEAKMKKSDLCQGEAQTVCQKESLKQDNIQETLKKDDIDQEKPQQTSEKANVLVDVEDKIEKGMSKKDQKERQREESSVNEISSDKGECSADLKDNDGSGQNKAEKVHLDEDEKQSGDSEDLSSSLEKDEMEKLDKSMDDSSSQEDSFIGFPDMKSKVHHVSSYAVSPDENIQVQSSVGPKGEAIDIIDGFTFISFEFENDMLEYIQRDPRKGNRRNRWLRGRRRRGNKFSRIKRHRTGFRKPTVRKSLDVQVRGNHSLPEDNSSEQSSAFASNDLDSFLDNNSTLNISYPIPTCKATEDGVTKLSDEMLSEGKLLESQNLSLLTSDNPDVSIDEHNESGQADDIPSDAVQQYEEVNAMDILYPKEKYKYYYNKDLRKDTKADGSNVFVRRAGKLVPLTSVFKSQKPAPSLPVPKQTVELVYIYDGGKLLTLGGSLTKINPSNSDSVRARVVLPIGTPPIAKGDNIDDKKKQVEAVEINEDMAKFALSALQDPNAKVVEKQETQEVPSNVKSTLSKDGEEQKKPESKKAESLPKKLSTVPVKPTKTNILDIIAAKLAMSDDESDGKEEEIQHKEEKNSDKGREEESEEDKNKGSVADGNSKISLKEDVKDEERDATVKNECAENIKDGLKCNQDDKEGGNTTLLESGKERQSNAGSSDDIKEESKSEMKIKAEDSTKEQKAGENAKSTDQSKDVKENPDVKEANLHGGEVNCKSPEEKLNTDDTKTVLQDDCDISKGSENIEPKPNNSSTNVEKSVENDASSKGKKSLTSEIRLEGNSSLSENQKMKEETNVKKGEEMSVDSNDSITDVASTAIRVSENPSKVKVFKRNVYRFPSLSREMKRLNMNFVKYVDKPLEDDQEASKIDLQEACTHEFCKLGCVCETLQCRSRDPEHCGRIECMFDCTCRDESWKHPVSGSGRTMNAVSIFNLDREQMEGLAIREKDFKRTVIQTGNEVILVGAERKKRERKIPGRYRDSAMWAGNDYVSVDPIDAETPLVKEEYPGIPIGDAYKYIRKCSVIIPWYDIKGISVWCMDHSCYDCKCFKDVSYCSDFGDDHHEQRGDPCPPVSDLEPQIPAMPLQTPVTKPREPSCVIVNVDVRNDQSRRRYFWKLKEWYHPLKIHSARTCGYYCSKKRTSEETKQVTIAGPETQDTSPEQMVENVVRSLRYEKCKEYMYGTKYYESVGGASPLKLRNLVGKNLRHLDNSTSILPGAATVIDLTVRDLDENSPALPSKMLVKRTKSQDDCKKQCQFESASSAVAKKRRLSDTADLNSQRHKDMSDDAPFSKPNEEAESVINPQDDLPPNEENFGVTDALKQGNHAPARKSLSLVEMMVAEEKRGELEIDLSTRVPGNAMLVAEGRFRKLINMNIIGVIGINKAGRCIISSVDSAQSLRTMQRIHTMISNNTLDVGPNMREIFFPPAHAASRPRFVMIRCDSQMKWEIVGVVQKKGPAMQPKRYAEQRHRSVQSKSMPTPPQVIDLEDEEDEKQEKTDFVDVHFDKEITAADELESYIEKSSFWEGSFPKIASVQGGSDVELPDDTTRALVKDSEESLSSEGNAFGKCPTIPSSMPNLIPLDNDTLAHKPELMVLDNDSGKPSTTLPILSLNESAKTLKIAPKVPSTVPSPVISPQQLYFLPTTFSSTTTTFTTSLCSSPITSVAGMRLIRLNQTSNRIFGDSSVNTLVPISPFPAASGSLQVGSPSTAVLSKSNASVTSPDTLSTGPFHISVNPNTHLENIPINLALDPGHSSIPLSPATTALSTVRSATNQKNNDGITGIAANPLPTQKTFFMPSGSGGMSKMVLVPSNKSTTTPLMMLQPNSKGHEALHKKMLLVPSTVESGKMVLIPMPSSFGNESGLSGSGANLNVSGLPLLALPKAGSSVEQPSSAEVQLLSAISQPSVSPKPPNISGKVLNETGSKNICDNSLDDVVIIGSASNTLTISKVRSSSESRDQAHHSGVSVTTAPSFGKPSPGVAITTVVSSSSVVSSTLGQNMQNSSLLHSPKRVPPEALTGKKRSDSKPRESHSVKPESSNDIPVIEYEKQKVENKSDNDEITLLSPPLKKAKTTTDSEDIQEVNSSPKIKKFGYHWSAVDLSLNFKSVKLEWLLGTIRKTVLINIYRMSVKTQSPVTLSVKNGTSMSMLYGLARKICGEFTDGRVLPVLILGSVVSAVMSSSSASDLTLFKANAVKYFIREPTGELASYTYSSSGDSLVKLASKKRAESGEMIGIGETISLQSVRDMKFLEPSQSVVAKETSKEKKASQSTDCTCISDGHYMCMGHSTVSANSSASENKNIVHSDPLPLPQIQTDKGSAVDHENSVKLPLKIPVVKGTEQTLDSCEKQKVVPKISSSSEKLSLSLCKGEEPQTLQNEGESVVTLSAAGSDCEIVCVKKPVTTNIPTENRPLFQERFHKKDDKNGDPQVEESELIDVEDEEMIDVEAGCDVDSIVSNLRDQMTVSGSLKGRPGRYLRTSASSSFGVIEQMNIPLHSPPPSESAQLPSSHRTLQVQTAPALVIESSNNPLKRKRGKSDHEYEKPCPRSKKVLHSTKSTSTLFLAGTENLDSVARPPLHLSHLKSPADQGSDDKGISVGPTESVPRKESISRKLPKIGRRVQRLHKQECKFVDIESLGDERNSQLHNKLERWRRKQIRYLFDYLLSVVSQSVEAPSTSDGKTQAPKIWILKRASKICSAMQQESARLIEAEIAIRQERSALMKKLGAALSDKNDEDKMYWKKWVEVNMQNPSSMETVEKNWKPKEMDKEIMGPSSNESSLDMDTDDGGSLLSAPASPVPGALKGSQQSTQTPCQPPVVSKPTLTTKQLDVETTKPATLQEPGLSSASDSLAASVSVSSTSSRGVTDVLKIVEKYKKEGISNKSTPYPKPPLSFSSLIALAVKNSALGALPVIDIYNFICDFFPFYRTAPPGWKNGIRHCLSLNRCFQKVAAPLVDMNPSARKRCYWTVNPEKVLKLNADLKKANLENLEGLKESMEYPEFLSLIQEGDLRIDYSRALLVSDPSSSGEEEEEDGFPFVVMKDNLTPTNEQVHKQVIQSTPSTSYIYKGEHKTQNISSVVTSESVSRNMACSDDEPEIVCLS